MRPELVVVHAYVVLPGGGAVTLRPPTRLVQGGPASAWVEAKGLAILRERFFLSFRNGRATTQAPSGYKTGEAERKKLEKCSRGSPVHSFPVSAGSLPPLVPDGDQTICPEFTRPPSKSPAGTATKPHFSGTEAPKRGCMMIPQRA